MKASNLLLVAAVVVAGLCVTSTHAVVYPSGHTWRSGFSNDIGTFGDFAKFRNNTQDVAGTWHCRQDWGLIEAGGCRNYMGGTPGAGLDGPFNRGWPKNKPQWHAVGMLPENEQSDLKSCADGKYNAHYTKLGESIVAAGLNLNTTYIRLAWEANGDWYAWGVAKSSTDQYKNNFARTPTNFVACWKKAYTAIKAKATKVKFTWNMNKDGGADELAMYPGASYVDFIDVDYYNSWPTSKTIAEFNSNVNQVQSGDTIGRGLQKWLAFAKAQGKKLALSEWGLGSGDYPDFIEGMFQFFTANAAYIEYETYYNELDDTFRIYNPSSNPNKNSAAKYKARF